KKKTEDVVVDDTVAQPKKKPDKKPAAKVDPVEIDMDVATPAPPPEPAPQPAKPLEEPASPKADADTMIVSRVPAHESGTRHWTFMLGVGYVDPLSSSEPLVLSDVTGPASLAVQNGPIAGSGATVGDATIPAAIIGYRLTPKLALETVLGTPFTVKFQ